MIPFQFFKYLCARNSLGFLAQSLMKMSSTNKALPSKNLNTATDEEKRKFLDSFDTVLSDCDGVLWMGGKSLPGATEVMNRFKEIGRKTYFVTNNSTLTRAQFVKKCSDLGFLATEDNIISTAWLAAQYLKTRGFTKKVYIVGPKAIEAELSAVGVPSFGVGVDSSQPPQIVGVLGETVQLEEDVGAVIVGYDHYFSLPKVAKAASYLRDPSVLFIATNTDQTYPHKGNFVWPGTGTFVAAVETCAGRKARILGKPSNYIVEEFLKQQGIDPKRTLMIGDRCNTDIEFGNSAGMQTLLVLTGINQLVDIEEYWATNQTLLVPTYYATSIQDLIPIINSV